MSAVISVKNLNKTYAGGFQALKNINLEITKGEIFALLGPNGAGKTTLINIICGITNKTDGSIIVDSYDNIDQYRESRKMIGLVPQELTTDAFIKVKDTVAFSRGLFGKKRDDDFCEKILKDLSLWDKKDNRLMTLSGGMKRRVMIAKALAHEPQVLFLDEPTAGVDVELRKDMWQLVRKLRESGVTIILTTHYIEEAEDMADRIGIINNGEIKVIEEKEKLMSKLGTKQLLVELNKPLTNLPSSLSSFDLRIDNSRLIYTYDAKRDVNCVSDLLEGLKAENISYCDISSKQSSLEEIFVHLVHAK